MYTPYEVRAGGGGGGASPSRKRKIDYIKIKIVPFIIHFGGNCTIRYT